MIPEQTHDSPIANAPPIYFRILLELVYQRLDHFNRVVDVEVYMRHHMAGDVIKSQPRKLMVFGFYQGILPGKSLIYDPQFNLGL